MYCREEGTIPYIPELPVNAEAIINYNQSLFMVQGIHTSPAGLESTSLVLSYGLGTSPDLPCVWEQNCLIIIYNGTVNVLHLAMYSFLPLWRSYPSAKSKFIRIKRQFKSTLNSQNFKFCQISYTLNIIRLQYIYQFSMMCSLSCFIKIFLFHKVL